MSMHHSLAAALWLLTAVGAYALVASWADDAQSGKLHPWVLVIVFWGAALVSVAIHHLSRYLSECFAEGADAFKRTWDQLGPVVRLHATRLSAQLAEGADALKGTWLRNQPEVGLRLTRVSRRLGQGLNAIQRYWLQHGAVTGVRASGLSRRVSQGADRLRLYWLRRKPVGALHARRLFDRLLAQAPDALRRDRARHKAVAG